MCLWGSNESHPESGENIPAGLPNITGKLGNPTKPKDGEVLTGLDTDSLGKDSESAIYLSNKVTNAGGLGTTGGWGYLTMTLDASRNNPIYGNSNTVQPPAFVVHIWKRVEMTA